MKPLPEALQSISLIERSSKGLIIAEAFAYIQYVRHELRF
jgi:hypothetical protein